MDVPPEVSHQDSHCYVCLDDAADEPLLRNICACKSTAIHRSCQRRLVENAALAGYSAACTVCQQPFANVKYEMRRRQRTMQYEDLLALNTLLFHTVVYIIGWLFFGCPICHLLVFMIGGLYIALVLIKTRPEWRKSPVLESMEPEIAPSRPGHATLRKCKLIGSYLTSSMPMIRPSWARHRIKSQQWPQH